MYETDNPDHHEVFSSLQHALPTNCVLVGYAPLRTLTLLSCTSDQQPFMVVQERFTANEWAFLLLLLHAYPVSVGYEQFQTVLHDGVLPHNQVHQQRAKQPPPDLGKVRNIISSLRTKLTAFPLTLSVHQEIGYVITVTADQPGAWLSEPVIWKKPQRSHHTTRNKITKKS
jgi:hypothetical protein